MPFFQIGHDDNFYQIPFDNYLLMKTLFARERKFIFIADKRVLNAKLKKAVRPIKISFYNSLFVFSRQLLDFSSGYLVVCWTCGLYIIGKYK